MLIYWLSHLLFSLLPWIPLFQIGMLVDCVTNRSIKSSKVGWVIVILVAQGLGAFIYFFFGPSSSFLFLTRTLGRFVGFVQDQYRQLEQEQKRRQVQPKADYEQPFENYGQGYLAQTPLPPIEEYELASLPLDEQPQISYPPLPQQQQDASH